LEDEIIDDMETSHNDEDVNVDDIENSDEDGSNSGPGGDDEDDDNDEDDKDADSDLNSNFKDDFSTIEKKRKFSKKKVGKSKKRY
jgi:hypothetical protein